MNDHQIYTTRSERQPRISTLIADAGEFAVQDLLEFAVRIIDEQGIDPGVCYEAGVLGAKIRETMNPEPPCFGEGDRVSSASDASAKPTPIGRVVGRYLNERGDWEYQIWHPSYGTNPYGEADLDPIS